MVTLTRNLTALSDTGFQSSGNWFPAPNPMTVGVGKYTGIRFQNVTVPKNAIINSATVSFTNYSVGSGNFGLAYGEASDNAPAWVDPGILPGNVSTTTANIAVPSTSPWDVTAIVQEIVNRAGWVSGNALAFVDPDLGAATATKNWDNASASQTVLTVVHGVSDILKEVSQVSYSAAVWPYVFQRSSQPYGARQMSPALLVPVNNPPFQNAGETSAQQAIALSAAQPSPWGYNFPGGPQPYAPRRLPADIINYTPPVIPPDNPPFEHPQRSPLGFLYEILQWQPDIWPDVFIGGRQAYAPAQLPPVIMAVPADDPPFQTVGKTAQARAITQLWQPNPWVYAFAGARQPYTKGLLTPPDTPVNNPPFRHRGKSSQVLTAVWQWQPDAWPKLYLGGRGPYARRTMPPSVIAVAPDIGQKIIRNVVIRQRLVFGPGKEPGLQ